jgi:hypothetical protein
LKSRLPSAQRDDRARLARAGGHHHEGLAVAVLPEGLADTADGARLVVPLDDGRVDRGIEPEEGERASHGVSRFLSRSCRNTHGAGHFLEFIVEVGQVVTLPKGRKFLNGAGFRHLGYHRFLQVPYRRFSLVVMSRAVTGYALPPGNSITTQKRGQPASISPSR